MSVVGSILVMVLILSLLTVVHEWGHYIAARIFKVKVNEFAIFMGPKIFSRVGKKTGTVFSIRCIPIGGFCALEGEETTEESADAFSNKPWYQRAVILVAGVFMNFMLAIVIVTVMFAFSGFDTRTVSVVSDGSSAWTMPMEMTGLVPGDEVIAYNGHSITTPMDYTLYTYIGETEDVSFTVKKQNGTKEYYLLRRTFDRQENSEDAENPGTLKTDVEIYRVVGKQEEKIGTYTSYWDNNRSLTIRQTYEDGRILEYFYGPRDGISAIYVTETAADGTVSDSVRRNLSESYTDEVYVQALIEEFNTAGMFRKFGFSFTYAEKENIFRCFGQSFLYTWSLIKSVFLSLWWLITGQLGMDALAGPIGITSLVNDVVTLDVATSLKVITLVDMTALISANLAVFNLLPIPGLDGGKLLFILIELLRGGKKIKPEKEGIISLIFFALLILLAIVIAGNDIFRLIKG